MKIESIKYTTALDNHSYAYACEGFIYKIPGYPLTGWHDTIRGTKVAMNDLECQKVLEEEKILKVTEVELCDLIEFSQALLAELMEEDFPWDESSFGSKQAYLEWDDPQTIQGVIAKSLRDRRYFYKVVSTPVWREAVEETACYSSNTYYTKQYSKVNGTWFFVESGFDTREGYWARLTLPEDQAQVQTRADQEKAEKAAQAAAEKAKKQEYAHSCTRIARTYGVAFTIVLRCFKGNEEQVKAFANSLANVIDAKAFYNKNAFDTDAYSDRRITRQVIRDEINRLGINIGDVDPLHIAKYILACLEAGKIIKHFEA